MNVGGIDEEIGLFVSLIRGTPLPEVLDSRLESPLYVSFPPLLPSSPLFPPSSLSHWLMMMITMGMMVVLICRKSLKNMKFVIQQLGECVLRLKERGSIDVQLITPSMIFLSKRVSTHTPTHTSHDTLHHSAPHGIDDLMDNSGVP
jgi:hypothetical protein